MKSESQRHCRNHIFNRMMSHSFHKELCLPYLRRISKGSMGMCFICKHSQRIPRESPPPWPGCWEHRCYVNWNHFPSIPLRHLGSCFPQSMCLLWVLVTADWCQRSNFFHGAQQQRAVGSETARHSVGSHATSPCLPTVVQWLQPAQAGWGKRLPAVNPGSKYKLGVVCNFGLI